MNVRATRVFCPTHPLRIWIAGDVVIAGFDTARRDLCDLSEVQQDRSTGPGPIHYPDGFARSEQGRSYTRYVEITEERIVSTTLSIRDVAGAAGECGRLHARLARQVATPDSGSDGSVEGDWGDPILTDTIRGFTAKRLDEFAEGALDVLRARFLLSDRAVHVAFRAT